MKDQELTDGDQELADGDQELTDGGSSVGICRTGISKELVEKYKSFYLHKSLNYKMK